MNAAPRLDAALLARHRPVISTELRRLIAREAVPAAAALEQVFAALFGGGYGPRDEMRFLLYAAPIARRIAIELAPADQRLGSSEVRIRDVREWLNWLDMFDPLCARMIDLHYIAGLSAKATAAALQVPAQTVVRDLRFAKSWLQTKL